MEENKKKSTLIQVIIIIVLVAILGGLIAYVLNSNSSSNSYKNERGNFGGGGMIGGSSQGTVTVTSTQNSDGTYSLDLDNSKWNYDETNNIYYQIGVAYCANPETTDYETLGIYVPGDYFTGTKNSDGTYTCTINKSGKVENYTVTTAPIVIPVNTPGYSAQHSPSSYSSNDVIDYLKQGFIYVYAGCRGRYESATDYNSGAPWGVTDLKAAIRYLRYNSSSIPADLDKIFTFGMSGGGAQSAIVGATGDSELYTDYLKSIGAVMKDKAGNNISDAVYGSMCWCPITNLDIADAAYEWNMGQFMTTGTRADGTFTKELSNDLAKAYAEYINKLGLKDSNGNTLYLDQIKSADAGIYTAGTYYDYVLNVLNTSLNNYLKDNNLGEDYIKSLNTSENWITYDSSTNTAKISSLESFAKYQKNASKSVGAFDNLSKTQAENKVFGNANSTELHFDSIMANLLKTNSSKYSSLSNWDGSYATSYSEDLESIDSIGKDITYRVNMYNPMYYLCDYYEGNGTSNVAKYWRINTGITQGDTANVTEINLALALQNNSNVESIDFTTVWGQGHTTAERTGNSTTNFINWVNECLK